MTKPVKQVLTEVHSKFSDKHVWGSGKLFTRNCMCLLGAIAICEGIVTQEEVNQSFASNSIAIGSIANQQAIYDLLTQSPTVTTLAEFLINDESLALKDSPAFSHLVDSAENKIIDTNIRIVYSFNDGMDLVGGSHESRKLKAYNRTMNVLQTVINSL